MYFFSLRICLSKRVSPGGVAVPLVDLQLTAEGQAVSICFWREAALTSLKTEDWVELSHMKGSHNAEYGFKLNSTACTVISVSL